MVEQEVHTSFPAKNVDPDEDEVILVHPFSHLTQKGFDSKNVLSKLWRAFNQWLNVPKDKLRPVANILDRLYCASLLGDDVEDDSELRGGIPTAHLIYGTAKTLNTANYIALVEMKKLLGVQEPKVIDYIIELGLELFRSQGMEVYYKDRFICPTESEYIEFTGGKFGSLLTFSVRLLQLFSNNKTDFSVLIQKLSLFCQIYNDYLSLHSKKYSTLKTFCDDVTEGKFSFPIVHAIQSQPDDDEVLNILKQRTTDIEIKKRFVSLLEKFGSFRYTRKTLEKLRDEAVEEMNKFGGNSRIEDILRIVLNNLETEVYYECF
ncbi:terpene synthase-like isoform X1 [Tenebrio molitor]|uniref:terpene synthase-like isoform X1 n=1 Tax=Tenebrio molitor TaxID=7067 RepID=UPI00362470C3